MLANPIEQPKEDIESKYQHASLNAFYQKVLKKAGIGLHQGGEDFLRRVSIFDSPEVKNQEIRDIIKELGLEPETFHEYE